ncbi:MAG TPA: hypothetical protein DC047_18030 [Blastocatellia bacterium]|nr:hypothetical protein [Blastocatellia bacterium]
MQALKEANIEEHGAQHVRRFSCKNTIVYWQPAENRIELVVDHEDGLGALHCRFSILPIAHLVAQFFLEDTAAIRTLVAVFEYLQGSLSDLLPSITDGIQARNVHLSYPLAPPYEKKVFQFVHSLLGTRFSLWELNHQQRSKALRGEDTGEWRGGSLPALQVSDEQRASISRNYPPLLRHWKNIKKLRQSKLGNWRHYAKFDEPDTPDDLLDQLDGKVPPVAESGGEAYPSIPSTLALEHAARRAGIEPNRCSSNRLGRLRREGDKILNKSKPSTK